MENCIEIVFISLPYLCFYKNIHIINYDIVVLSFFFYFIM